MYVLQPCSANLLPKTSNLQLPNAQAHVTYGTPNPSQQPMEIPRFCFDGYNWHLFGTLASFASEFKVEEWNEHKTSKSSLQHEDRQCYLLGVRRDPQSAVLSLRFQFLAGQKSPFGFASRRSFHKGGLEVVWNN
jgi:hypothetical protein